MYKVLLADDEGIVIEALTFILEKNFSGNVVIESAKTGRSVIELAEHFRPDIVFMDIQMPGINGIEAMREIQKSMPGTIFIVLSAYERFDYAREAMEIGALCYLNKPIDKNVIVEVTQRAMDEIDGLRKKRSNDLMIREKLETIIPVIESGFIYSVLFQDNYANETERYMQLLGIGERKGYMMVIKIGESEENGELTNSVGASVRVSSNYQEISAIIKEFFKGIVGPLMANMVLVYVPVADNDDADEYDNRIEIIENVRKMVRKLSTHIDAKFRVGIGSVKPTGQAGVSYTEAMNSFRGTVGSVAHAKDLAVDHGIEDDYPIETEDMIFRAIREGNSKAAIQYMNDFFNWMLESNYENTMDIKLKVLELVLHAEYLGYLNGGMMYKFSSRQGYLKTVVDMDTYENLRAWSVTKIQNVCQNVGTKREEQAANLIHKAKIYIDDHFDEDITLDDISRQINISPYYFSKLFKEEVGQSFIEYITGLRMDKAKILLATTNKSMKEICSAIGYADPNYFSRTFKKNVGVTPTEYKENK